MIVCVVRREAVEQSEIVLGQSKCQRDIPHLIHARGVVVAVVAHTVVPVVDLKEPFAFDGGHICRRQCVSEVGMVEVGEHRAIETPRLFDDRIDVALNRLAYGVAALWLNQLLQVDRIDMNGVAVELIGDLLALDHDEFARPLKLRPQLRQRLEAHLFRPIISGVRLNPIRAESLFEIFDMLRAQRPPIISPNRVPLLALRQDVVIRQHEEVVVVVHVPIDDVLRGRVAIGPIGMGVGVSLEPLWLSRFVVAACDRGTEQNERYRKQSDGHDSVIRRGGDGRSIQARDEI